MAQHTSGPWAVKLGNRGTLCVVSSEAWICGELSNGNGEHFGEGTANAHLIAAAPDLLEALREAKEILDLVAKSPLGPSESGSTADKINRAIAKAEGK